MRFYVGSAVYKRYSIFVNCFIQILLRFRGFIDPLNRYFCTFFIFTITDTDIGVLLCLLAYLKNLF